MKLISLIVVLVSFGLSQDYKTLTKDNEIKDRNLVQVEQTIPIIEKRIFTVRSLTVELQVLRTQLVDIQSRITEAEAKLVIVQSMADAVILKEGEGK